MPVLRFLLRVIWFIVKSLLTTAVVMALLFLYAYKVEPGWIVVKEQPVEIAGLPPAFDGFRIVQLSDLHGTRFPDRGIIHRVNKLNPDLVVITGDVFDGMKGTKLEYADEVFKGIKSRYGIFFVLGNNDFYFPRDKLSKQLSGLGIKVLVNQNHRISIGGQTLWIIGVNDPHLRKADMPKALEGTEAGTKILLAHSPEIFDEAAGVGIQLVLAGHTHGGQINIPFFPRISAFVRKGYEQYLSGLYKVDHTQMYVNQGLGVGKIPLRFMVRPEITVVTLRGPKD